LGKITDKSGGQIFLAAIKNKIFKQKPNPKTSVFVFNLSLWTIRKQS
jgi:hypothetical protein